MPAAPTQRPTIPAPADAVPNPAVPTGAVATGVVVGPNPPHRRFWLLLKLLLVPMAVVCLPTLVVTGFFGQRPEPKAPPDAAFSALRDSLERAARERLPEGTPTFGARFEDLSLPCAAADADARLEGLRGLAARCGGTLTDQGADPAGRHLLVELPAGSLPRFRPEAAGGVIPPAEPTTGTTGGERVFLRLTLAPSPPAATTTP